MTRRRTSDASAVGATGPTAPPQPSWWLLAAIFVGVVAVEMAIAGAIKSKGIGHVGDAPAYVIAAQSWLHFTPHIQAAMQTDLRAHTTFNNYPLGHYPEILTGPRGVVSPFEPGMGMLLAPFVAVGHLFLGVTLAMVCWSTAGLMYLHRRVSSLVGLGGRGQILLGLLFVAPAVLLAITQIYPDFISGVFLGAALIEVAVSEQAKATTARSGAVVAVAVALAFLPWLQVKNFVPAVVVLLAWTVVAGWSQRAWRAVAVVWVVALAAWMLLLVYNQRYAGHWLGLPEAAPGFTKNGFEYIVGLAVDRNQGIFVQVPLVVLGLLGLWLVRKALPTAVIATVVSLGAVWFLNGDYITNPYGGDSLSGRFMWTMLPALLAWTAVVIARWEAVQRTLWLPIGLVAAAWLYQGQLLIRNDHEYYNGFGSAAALTNWSGWWGPLNHLLPQLVQPGEFLGKPGWWALVVELAALALLVVGALAYMRPPKSKSGLVEAHRESSRSPNAEGGGLPGDIAVER